MVSLKWSSLQINTWSLVGSESLQLLPIRQNADVIDIKFIYVNLYIGLGVNIIVSVIDFIKHGPITHVSVSFNILLDILE